MEAAQTSFELSQHDYTYMICRSCDMVTGFYIKKCHICGDDFKPNPVYRRIYSPELFKRLLKALMNLPNRQDKPQNMISISIEGYKGYGSELWQIYKEIQGYTYAHLERDTHRRLVTFAIDAETFIPILPQGYRYNIQLIYGDDNV